MNRLLPIVAVLLAIVAGFVAVERWGPKPNKKKQRVILPAEAADLHAVPLSDLEEQTPFLDSEWLDNHFTAPADPQGDPPEGWPEITASLQPESCGLCHPTQYADWKESWHALGMGDGVLGQLVDWDGKNDKKVRQCNRCHAPLSEQYPFVEDGVENPAYDPELRDKGLTCGGCHVRAHERFGPEGKNPPIENAPHGGYTARDEFKDSRFCYGCHDFRKGDGLEGKRFQETYEEWRRTPYAAEGVTCQSCHMPEGRHLFKGVHDHEMVKSGFTATTDLIEKDGRIQGSLSVENTGTGHRMPTYTTPQFTLIVEQLDAQGQALKKTKRTDAIARYVSPNLKVERFDTRLMPGESHSLNYELDRHDRAHSVHARVEVWPDEAYRRLYEIKLRKPENHPIGLEAIQRAHQASIDSRFVAWEETIQLDASD
ncbi:MAG: multiheme c-type cytochrome [Myxococcota bacterium]|nr:multiheme c-type cytochrome [Myxococcota bacterium]